MRCVHRRQRVESQERVAEVAGTLDGRCGKRLTETDAARRRPDVEPLELAAAVRESLHRDGADERAVVVPCDEQHVVVARQGGELLLEAAAPEVLSDRVGVLAEHRAELGDVAVSRVGDQRSARSSSTSSALGSQAPAATFARTCSGFVAPAITEVTAGIASRPPIATSSSEMPRSSA